MYLKLITVETFPNKLEGPESLSLFAINDTISYI